MLLFVRICIFISMFVIYLLKNTHELPKLDKLEQPILDQWLTEYFLV